MYVVTINNIEQNETFDSIEDASLFVFRLAHGYNYQSGEVDVLRENIEYNLSMFEGVNFLVKIEQLIKFDFDHVYQIK